MASKASTVNTAIKAALANIDGTGTYVNTLVGVYRRFEAPQPKDDATDFPYITYGTADINEETWDANNSTKKCEATVVLHIFVAWPDVGTDPEDLLTDLYFDVKTALETDHTLGGALFGSEVEGLGVDEMDTKFGYVSGVVRYRVTYTHTVGART